MTSVRAANVPPESLFRVMTAISVQPMPAARPPGASMPKTRCRVMMATPAPPATNVIQASVCRVLRWFVPTTIVVLTTFVIQPKGAFIPTTLSTVPTGTRARRPTSVSQASVCRVLFWYVTTTTVVPTTPAIQQAGVSTHPIR